MPQHQGNVLPVLLQQAPHPISLSQSLSCLAKPLPTSRRFTFLAHQHVCRSVHAVWVTRTTMLQYRSCRVQLKCDGTPWRTGGKWRGNWRIEWVASTLHTTSEHGVSSITTADTHTSAASSRLNWRPRRRRNTKSGFCACAITFQTQSNTSRLDMKVHPSWRNTMKTAPHLPNQKRRDSLGHPSSVLKNALPLTVLNWHFLDECSKEVLTNPFNDILATNGTFTRQRQCWSSLCYRLVRPHACLSNTRENGLRFTTQKPSDDITKSATAEQVKKRRQVGHLVSDVTWHGEFALVTHHATCLYYHYKLLTVLNEQKC